jgi:hypothetical protein
MASVMLIRVKFVHETALLTPTAPSTHTHGEVRRVLCPECRQDAFSYVAIINLLDSILKIL